MKKLLALLLICGLLLTIAACGRKKSAEGDSEAPYTKGQYGVKIPEEPITIHFQDTIKQLYFYSKAENLKSVAWPTQIDDVWRDWGYVEITDDGTINSRTFGEGQYQKKYVNIILDTISILESTLPGMRCETIDGVPWRRIQLQEEPDAERRELCKVAGLALYLQAWYLIPVEEQGVTLVLPDGTELTETQLLEGAQG